MRVVVVPFTNQNPSIFGGNVKVVGTNASVNECQFQSLTIENSLYVLDQTFDNLLDKCGAHLKGNYTVFIQFIVQYSNEQLMTAFDPVYMVYCDLTHPQQSRQIDIAVKRRRSKASSDSNNNAGQLVRARSSTNVNQVKMTFTSKLTISNSLDSLPREVVVGSSNSSSMKPYRDDEDEQVDRAIHNMSFVIRKRSKDGSVTSAVPIEDVKLSDILEVEVSNSDTSYFKYVYLQQCSVEFEDSRQPRVILIEDGCPTKTVRRFLIDWMSNGDSIAHGEILESAVGQPDAVTNVSTSSFSYSAFWPSDSKALAFNCSVRLCTEDTVDEICQRRSCPAIPGFTYRHRRKRREAPVFSADPSSAAATTNLRMMTKLSKDQDKTKQKKKTKEPSKPLRKMVTPPANADVFSLSLTAIWICCIGFVYLAGLVYLVRVLSRFLRL